MSFLIYKFERPEYSHFWSHEIKNYNIEVDPNGIKFMTNLAVFSQLFQKLKRYKRTQHSEDMSQPSYYLKKENQAGNVS